MPLTETRAGVITNLPFLQAVRACAACAALAAIAACSPSGIKALTGVAPGKVSAVAATAQVASDTRSDPRLDGLIAYYASYYEVPEALVRRVVQRESKFNPQARNGPYWGLMQILPATARTMGYKGEASGLLDAETNLKYAVKYLRGAYMVAQGNHDQAVRFYASGYYYDAKRMGLLEETGLR